jgi:hypothetical protein
MPTPTYTALATTTLVSAASSVTFGSIPATYRDLILVYNGSLTGNAGHTIRFNGDSGANYSVVAMFNNASAAFSSQTGLSPSVVLQDSSSQVLIVSQIMDYSATDKHKTVLSRTNTKNAGTDYVEALASRYASTSAITSILYFPSADQFAAGSTFSLYGVIA